MIVLHVHNAHEGLLEGLNHLRANGIWQDSRNGRVIRSSDSVSTVYSKPLERVVFWQQRDANPYFHLYEALWMLAGRNDVHSVARYAKQMLQYSDDGSTLHDAYGYRWRRWFGHDQISTIVRLLKNNQLDRQLVLQMWDAPRDLARGGKAVPCNLIATFSVDPIWNKLDLTVFCRSNDIIWGTYGANAVHFGFLLEYVGVKAGIEVGKYTQISINYHAYEEQYNKCLPILDSTTARVHPHPGYPRVVTMPFDVDYIIPEVLDYADSGGYPQYDSPIIKLIDKTEWGSVAHRMMWAHAKYKSGDVEGALSVLNDAPSCDWTRAGTEWIYRRLKRDVSAVLESATTPEGA